MVVGAGAAGLAVAAELGRRGIESDILDRAPSLGNTWTHRYDSLRLHTPRRLSGLPGFSIPRRYGRWVARDDVVAYLRMYASHHRLRPQLGVTVTRLDRSPDDRGWVVTTSGGPVRTSTVVMATGFANQPVLPAWATSIALTGLDAPAVVHSSAYRNAGSYRNRRVLVVGGGNSASEIAVDLAAGGAVVSLSVRRPPDIVPRSVLGIPSQAIGIALQPVPGRLVDPLAAGLRRLSVPDLGAVGLPAPVGGASARLSRTVTTPILDHGFVAQVRAGRIRVVAGVGRLVAGGVEFVDGSSAAVDTVICATGYRPGLEPVVGHLGVLNQRGVPQLRGGATVPGAPGLYFAGISVQLTGLLREAGREARAIAAAVADPPGEPEAGSAPTPPPSARPPVSWTRSPSASPPSCSVTGAACSPTPADPPSTWTG